MSVAIPPLRIEVLPLPLSPDLRHTLAGWLQAYFAAHPMARPVGHTVETMLPALFGDRGCHSCWLRTTQREWLSGGLQFALFFKDLDIRFEGEIRDGRPSLRAVTVHPEPPPVNQPWTGVPIQFERVQVLAPASFHEMDVLLEDLWRRALERWLPFAEHLKAAVDADASDEEERAIRLTSDFRLESQGQAGADREHCVTLAGVRLETCAELNDGEWVVLLDESFQERARGAVLVADAEAEKLVLKLTTNGVPTAGKLQPLVRAKIIEQKRAIIREMRRPTGAMYDLVRLFVNPRAVAARTLATPDAPGNPKIERSRAQSRAVKLALGMEQGQLLIIQGPPGTGKSTTAAEIIYQVLKRDPLARILVVSHSNHGVDNLLGKFQPYLPLLGKAARPARVGKRERLHEEAKAFYVAPGTSLESRNVIFTTCDSLALQDAAGAARYDYVILDEANRATIMDSLIVLARGARFILVGDDLQLPPVLSETERAIARQADDSVVATSLFHWLVTQRCPYVLLDVQNRMHPEIGSLVSETFYQGRVKNGKALPTRPIAPWLSPRAACWLDTSGLRGRREARGAGTSFHNRAEVDVVHALLRRLLKGTSPQLSIGVITTYADQRALLSRRLARLVPAGRAVKVDTVDAFEGRECDVVVVSMVRSNCRGVKGFLEQVQRINVALSRARRLLVIVGDASTLKGGYFDVLQARLRRSGAMIDAAEAFSRQARRRAVSAGTIGGPVVTASPTPATSASSTPTAGEAEAMPLPAGARAAARGGQAAVLAPSACLEALPPALLLPSIDRVA